MSLLVTLDALLQESSVTNAAKRLGLSTPAVSHALAKLRERFDDPLLVRAGRHMVLTPRAESLRGLVRHVITHAGRVFETPEPEDLRTLERTFTLSLTDYVMIVVGDHFDQLIREGAPAFQLRFLLNTTDDAYKLRSGETDLAVGIYGSLPPELKMRPLLTDRLICVVREGHPSIGESISLAQYIEADHIQVAPRGRPGGYVDSFLAEQGYTRRVTRAVPFFQIAFRMTANTDSILTIPERIAQLLAPPLGLKLLEPPLALQPYTLSMLWHPRYDNDFAHKWLRERLVEATQSAGGLAHKDARKHLSPNDPTNGRALS